MDRKFEEKYSEPLDNGAILRLVSLHLHCSSSLKSFCPCTMYTYAARTNLIKMSNYKSVWVPVTCFKSAVFFYINTYLGDRDKSLEECPVIN